jgi:anti-sigma regulatory factor (Ser/Thr protein kinase)
MAMFRSRPAEWRHARAFVEDFCAAAALPRETGLRACLVLEELFVNTVKHGHAGGSDAPVWIALADESGRVTLTYEDLAAPFNPFARERREMLEALAPTRREGGLGVILAQALAGSTDYAYLYGRNRIRVTLA